jgi:AraC-like DNA-binding protein
MLFEHISIGVIFFFILYGITGVVPAIAAVYLLLRRGNAFAPDVSPPVRLRRWAASFFAVAALGHVWWYLLYIYSCDIHSVVYYVVVVLDCVSLFTTIAGTLLAMLQDRRRRIWPALVSMIPFVALFGVLMVNPSDLLKQITSAYVLLLYVLFTAYMVFAVRQYGRWLNDNYADLENKKVWLSQVVTLVCMLLIIIYEFANSYAILYLLHIIELLLFGLLLWRVETLPQLESAPPSQAQQPTAAPATIDLKQIERLLEEQCVATQLYLQHELSREQLAVAVGTNRSYLSQYFSRQGITYNTYINNLRVNHFIKRYEEGVAAGQSVGVKQLVHESGFSSYRTFSRAFTERMGQSVTAWMGQSTE